MKEIYPNHIDDKAKLDIYTPDARIELTFSTPKVDVLPLNESGIMGPVRIELTRSYEPQILSLRRLPITSQSLL